MSLTKKAAMSNNGVRKIIELENRISDLESDVESLKKQVDEHLRAYEETTTKLKKKVDEIEDNFSMAKQTLSLQQVAKMLLMTPETAYKLARAGKIPYGRPTEGKLVFNAKKIIEWLESNPSKMKQKMEKVQKAEEWRAKHPVNKKQGKD